MSRREPNPLTARRLPFKPFVGVVDLSQEREVTAKDLLRTRRKKKKGKRAKKKTSAPSHPVGSFLNPHTTMAAAIATIPEREVTAADILTHRRRKR